MASVMTDILATIFCSEARVKIMRLFLFNEETIFDMETVSNKSKVNKKLTKKEITLLEKAKLIKKRDFYKIVQSKKRGKVVEKKIKTRGYLLNQDFPYITALKQLLIKTKMLEGGEIVKKLSKVGAVKMIVVAGVFTQDKESRVDIFVVGNNIRKASLSNVIRSMEAELGKELVYVCFDTPDYQYRLSMNDKLIRDILDYPHQVLLDKISI